MRRRGPVAYPHVPGQRTQLGCRAFHSSRTTSRPAPAHQNDRHCPTGHFPGGSLHSDRSTHRCCPRARRSPGVGSHSPAPTSASSPARPKCAMGSRSNPTGRPKSKHKQYNPGRSADLQTHTGHPGPKASKAHTHHTGPCHRRDPSVHTGPGHRAGPPHHTGHTRHTSHSHHTGHSHHSSPRRSRLRRAPDLFPAGNRPQTVTPPGPPETRPTPPATPPAPPATPPARPTTAPARPPAGLGKPRAA